MELFWEKGYNGTSMQDLVDVTGLNRSSLYNSFGDKFSLFEESLLHYQQIQDKNLVQIIERSHSPKEAIRSLFEGISYDLNEGKQSKGCFIANCTSELVNQDERIHTMLVKNKERVVGVFESLIKEAQQKGEIEGSKDAKTLALFLFSSLNGLQLTSMIESDIQGVTDQIINSL